MSEFQGNCELLIDKLKVVNNKLLVTTPSTRELKTPQKKALSKIQEGIEDNETESSHVPPMRNNSLA